MPAVHMQCIYGIVDYCTINGTVHMSTRVYVQGVQGVLGVQGVHCTGCTLSLHESTLDLTNVSRSTRKGEVRSIISIENCIELCRNILNCIELSGTVQNYLKLYRTAQNWLDLSTIFQNYLEPYRTIQNCLELYRQFQNFKELSVFIYC